MTAPNLMKTHTDIHTGLSTAQVEESRRLHGSNEMPPPSRDPWWVELARKFADPLIVILIAAAIVTWLPELLGNEKAISGYVTDGGKWLKNISKFVMVTTLFLIGSNLSREKLKELGLKPVIHGVILWVILSVTWCCAIAAGWVNCRG